MSAHEEIARLLKDAAGSMKGDLKGALSMLQKAYGLAAQTGVADDAAVVAEELARAWGRAKSGARSLHYARAATKLAPAQKATWTTLAKTCELVADRPPQAPQQGRAGAEDPGAATAVNKAGSFGHWPPARHPGGGGPPAPGGGHEAGAGAGALPGRGLGVQEGRLDGEGSGGQALAARARWRRREAGQGLTPCAPR